jgi:multidrug resistance efflux pump
MQFSRYIDFFSSLVDQFRVLKPQRENLLTVTPRQSFFRILRLAFGLSILIIVGVILWRNKYSIISDQGYINAPIIVVRAPIKGNLISRNLKPGTSLVEGTTIGSIENSGDPALEVQQQSLTSQLLLAQVELTAIKVKLRDRRVIKRQIEHYLEVQTSLQSNYNDQQVKRYQGELKDAEHEAEFALVEAQRYQELVVKGGISQNAADRLQTNALRAQQVVVSKRALQQEAVAQLEASQQGLQLEGSRTFSDPFIRSQTLDEEIADLEQQEHLIQARIQQNLQELSRVSDQLKLQKRAILKITQPGVIWSGEDRFISGGYVSPGDTVVTLIDCQRLWIDTFLAERQVEKLTIGMVAKVRLLSDPKHRILSGRIQTIRSGVGRVVTGDQVAVPPPELIRRNLAVRIILDTPEQVTSDEFCGVGRSVAVTFRND